MRTADYSLRTLLVASILFISSCASIYTAAEMADAKENHKTAAILPFDVNINKTRLPKGMTIDMVMQQEHDEAYVVQQTCYSVLLKKQDKYTIEFQDIDKTNATIKKANISYDSLRFMSKDSIAKILGVDAVISGKVQRSQPMSTGAAVAMVVLTGASGATNEVRVDFTIHDGKNAKLLWKYNHKVSGGLGSSSEQMAESLMKQVSRKFPYKK